jgi:hypothetical protein
MAEEDAEGDGGNSGDGDLQDHIAHWVEVLDGWVKRIDLGMGRQEGDVASLNGNGAVDGNRKLHEADGADVVEGLTE